MSSTNITIGAESICISGLCLSVDFITYAFTFVVSIIVCSIMFYAFVQIFKFKEKRLRAEKLRGDRLTSCNAEFAAPEPTCNGDSRGTPIGKMV